MLLSYYKLLLVSISLIQVFTFIILCHMVHCSLKGGEYMSIGDNIRNFRKERGLSQLQLGERLKVSQQMIGQFENNANPPKLETLQKIATALDISLEQLLDINYFDTTMNLNTIKKQLSQIEVVESYLDLLGFSIKSNVTKWHWEDDSKEVQIVDDTEYILSKDGYSATFTQEEMDKLQVETKELIEGKFYKKLMKGQHNKSKS